MSIISRLQSMYGNMKPLRPALTEEQNVLVLEHFSARVRTIFTSHHLLYLIPSEVEESANYDNIVFGQLMKPCHYEDFGNVYDADKLERCLRALGMDEKFARAYIRDKREVLGAMWDGCNWSEDWVQEIGGVKGAVEDIINNY